jgi:hypothetical protein
MEENGQVSGRVRFGDALGNEIPADWAEALLRLMYERHRATFGALLAEVVTGQQFREVKPR